MTGRQAVNLVTAVRLWWQVGGQQAPTLVQCSTRPIMSLSTARSTWSQSSATGNTGSVYVLTCTQYRPVAPVPMCVLEEEKMLVQWPELAIHCSWRMGRRMGSRGVSEPVRDGARGSRTAPSVPYAVVAVPPWAYVNNRHLLIHTSAAEMMTPQPHDGVMRGAGHTVLITSRVTHQCSGGVVCRAGVGHGQVLGQALPVRLVRLDAAHVG